MPAERCNSSFLHRGRKRQSASGGDGDAASSRGGDTALISTKVRKIDSRTGFLKLVNEEERDKEQGQRSDKLESGQSPKQKAPPPRLVVSFKDVPGYLVPT
jgi:hypothetical protein